MRLFFWEKSWLDGRVKAGDKFFGCSIERVSNNWRVAGKWTRCEVFCAVPGQICNPISFASYPTRRQFLEGVNPCPEFCIAIDGETEYKLTALGNEKS